MYSISIGFIYLFVVIVCQLLNEAVGGCEWKNLNQIVHEGSQAARHLGVEEETSNQKFLRRLTKGLFDVNYEGHFLVY